jgi:hypothetical protein
MTEEWRLNQLINLESFDYKVQESTKYRKSCHYYYATQVRHGLELDHACLISCTKPNAYCNFLM